MITLLWENMCTLQEVEYLHQIVLWMRHNLKLVGHTNGKQARISMSLLFDPPSNHDVYHYGSDAHGWILLSGRKGLSSTFNII